MCSCWQPLSFSEEVVAVVSAKKLKILMYCKFLETNIIALKISYTNPGLMAFQTAYVDEASATISCKRKIYQLCKGTPENISIKNTHLSMVPPSS